MHVTRFALRNPVFRRLKLGNELRVGISRDCLGASTTENLLLLLGHRKLRLFSLRLGGRGSIPTDCCKMDGLLGAALLSLLRGLWDDLVVASNVVLLCKRFLTGC